MAVMQKKYLLSGSLAGLVIAGLASVAQAAPLILENVSAREAARQISEKYGINVVLKSDFGSPHRVSVTLDDADSPGSQLTAVNDLANALGADFNKTFVVSKAPDGQDTPVPAVDATGNVVFDSTTVPVQTAISTVAGVDNAEVQFVGDISGSVTLSAAELSDASAARQIAAQTHTRWKAFYALTRTPGGHATGGKVIGHTTGGSPIIELPQITYRHRPTAAEQQAQQQADQANTARQQAQGNPQQMPQPNRMPMNGYGSSGYPGYGYDPYGYGGYNPGGYNYGDPSNNGGYGYGSGGSGGYGTPPGYINNGSGVVLGTGSGYGSGPIIFQSGGYQPPY